jgi:hypothetical protein
MIFKLDKYTIENNCRIYDKELIKQISIKKIQRINTQEKDDTYFFDKTPVDLCKELTPLAKDSILQDIENENIKLINNEKHIRDEFLQRLDFNKDIVLIGSGPTLDRRINRVAIKEMFGDKISDNFYIVPINDKWLYCDEFDFAIGNDEQFWWSSQFMPSEKLFLTLSYSFGVDGNAIPYNVYKKFAKNLLCIYQNNNSCYIPRKYNDHVFENNINDILTIDIGSDTGGAISIKVLEKMGFKKFKLIGFGGVGNTKIKNGFEYIKKFKIESNKNCYFNHNYDQFKNIIDMSFYKCMDNED